MLAVAKSGGLYQQKSEQHKDWKRRITEDRLRRWREKPLHGQYPTQMDITTTKACFGWLKNVRLKMETEALLVAAQDQALRTKAHTTYIQKTTNDPKCRMCRTTDETVAHLLSSCSKLAGNKYLQRHNEVAKLVHRSICKAFNIKVTRQHWMHVPESVTENDKVKVLWDFDIQITARSAYNC